uniref:Apolipoprotein L3-like protein n=1 Tax=Catagonus wagneri TaxID=51154 RepID=A0A8C3W8W9_9CETA
AGTPTSENFFEEVVEYFRNTVRREELQLLLTEDEAWEVFVTEAHLSREAHLNDKEDLTEDRRDRGEADALRERLKELETDLALEDKDSLQQDQLDRKRFLEEFPRVKLELEAQIGKLRALADKVDKVHRNCTISNVVATSTGAVSGILTILGLALAPVTAGVSLALSATGLGLGAAAAVTSVSASIVDQVNSSLTESEASHLMSKDSNKVEVISGSLDKSKPQIVSLTKNFILVLPRIGKNIQALKLAKANPRLVANAKHFMTAGKVSVRNRRLVQNTFRGTALAMTKNARIMGAAAAGVGLLMDVGLLVKESIHLQEGAKTESAERLRQQAQELERKLLELTRIYESLQ